MECQMKVINCPREQVAGLLPTAIRVLPASQLFVLLDRGFANAVPAMMEAWGERSPLFLLPARARSSARAQGFQGN